MMLDRCKTRQQCVLPKSSSSMVSTESDPLSVMASGVVFVVCCDDDDTSLSTGEPPLVVQDLLRHTEQWNADGYSGEANTRYVIPWRIDNKYYAADVTLRVLDHKAWTAMDSDDVSVAEAFVFLAHKARQASLDAVKSAVTTHGVANVTLCVLVSHGKDANGPAAAPLLSEQQLEEFEQYCLEQGLEYVDADAEDDTVAEFGRTRQAVHRVVDALSSHMWPAMRMKTGGATAPPQAASAPPQPAVPMMIGGINVADMFAGLDDDDDGLDRAIQAALGLRSQLQGMSDENRRAAAAQVAMSFMQRFGEGDEDDDVD